MMLQATGPSWANRSSEILSVLLRTSFCERFYAVPTGCRYPLAILKDLDARRPTAAKLLGIPIVIWKDGAGAWRVFEDRCPHR